MATGPASSPQTWVIAAGPEATRSVRQGLVVGWSCQFWNFLLPEDRAEVSRFSLGSLCTWAWRQSSAAFSLQHEPLSSRHWGIPSGQWVHFKQIASITGCGQGADLGSFWDTVSSQGPGGFQVDSKGVGHRG